MTLNNLGLFFNKIKKTILEKEIIINSVIIAVKKETNIILNKENIKINKKTATITCNSKEKSSIYIKKVKIIELIQKELGSDLIKEIN